MMKNKNNLNLAIEGTLFTPSFMILKVFNLSFNVLYTRQVVKRAMTSLNEVTISKDDEPDMISEVNPKKIILKVPQKIMKKGFKKDPPIMFSFKNAFKDNIRHEPMVSLGNPFELLRLIGSIGWRVISACTDSRVSLFRELKILKGFAGYLLLMTKRHGATYTVKYLKSGHLAIQKSISKDHISSIKDIEPDLQLPRLSTSKLPRFIPLSDRRAIRSGNAFRIRY
jgi:hypothetical protein